MAVLAFDTSTLSCFARAGRLPLLHQLTAAHDCVTVQAVVDELKRGLADDPTLGEVLNAPWLRAVPMDDPRWIRTFAAYRSRLGSLTRNVGEAALLTWARTHGATVILDDRDARILAKEEGIPLRGSLGLLASGIREGMLTMEEAVDLIDEFRDAGAWLPPGSDFPDFCAKNGLLP